MLALPDNLTPWPIGQYPANPPPTLEQIKRATATLSLRNLGAADLPECVVVVDGGELPCRYEPISDGVIARAVKVNGVWHDPITFGFAPSMIAVMANQCAEIDAEGTE